MQDNLIRSTAKAAALRAIREVFGELLSESIQTTDATPLVILTIEPDLYTCGLIEISVVAKDDLGINGFRCKQIVGYEMGSALTLDTPIDVYPLVTEITGATFSVNAVSGSIEIELTGVAATTINWTVETKLINQVATNSP